jgi:hypothetical protein
MAIAKPAEALDRRAVMTAAFEADEKIQAAAEDGANPDPEPNLGAGDDAAPAEGLELPEEGAELEADADTAERKAERDEKGRFKTAAERAEAAGKKAAAKPDAAAGDQAADAGEKPAAATPASLRAPQSWKPDEREEWAKMPPKAQAAVLRREKDAAVAVQRAAEVGKQVEAFEKTVEPFRNLIAQAQAARGENYNPLPTIGGLLQTAAALQLAPMRDRAKIVAEIITNRGISIDAINEFLGGGTPAAPAEGAAATPPPVYRDPRVDSLEQRLAQQEQDRKAADNRRAQAIAQEQERAIDAFAADPKHEFYEDVRHDMADLLAGAAQRGVAMTMDEAYDRATRANPEVWKTIEHRNRLKAATAKNAATQRARGAAVSVRSSPSSTPTEGSLDSRRASLEQAWSESEGR